MYFLYIVIISRWKRLSHSSEYLNLNRRHQKMLCAKFLWNCLRGFGEELKCEKFIQTDDRKHRRWTTDNWRSEMLSWDFGSGDQDNERSSASLFNNMLHHIMQRFSNFAKKLFSCLNLSLLIHGSLNNSDFFFMKKNMLLTVH